MQKSKKLIIIVLILALAIGAAAYFSMGESYTGKVDNNNNNTPENKTQPYTKVDNMDNTDTGMEPDDGYAFEDTESYDYDDEDNIDDWALEYINTSPGVIKGYEGGLFKPEEKIQYSLFNLMNLKKLTNKQK